MLLPSKTFNHFSACCWHECRGIYPENLSLTFPLCPFTMHEFYANKKPKVEFKMLRLSKIEIKAITNWLSLSSKVNLVSFLLPSHSVWTRCDHQKHSHPNRFHLLKGSVTLAQSQQLISGHLGLFCHVCLEKVCFFPSSCWLYRFLSFFLSFFTVPFWKISAKSKTWIKLQKCHYYDPQIGAFTVIA